MNDDHREHDREAKRIITQHVEKYGWHAAMLETDGYLPTFVYTIGLYKTFGHAELISFGLKLELLHGLLCDCAELIENGYTIESYKPYNQFLDRYPVQFIPVLGAHYPEYFGYAGWFYGSWDFPAIQLVWPDMEGRFPWEEDFNDNLYLKQKLLDRDPHFKFIEKTNRGVYTTRQVMQDNYPIFTVHHEQDRDWQFLCGTTYEYEDLVVVCLEHIVEKDPSVNELYDLPYGWMAFREKPGDNWEREELEVEDEDEDSDYE